MAGLEDWAKENGLYLFWALVVAIIIIVIFLFGGMGMMMSKEGMTAGGNEYIGMQGYFAGGRTEAFRARRDLIEGMNGNGNGAVSGVLANPRGTGASIADINSGLTQSGLTLQEQLEIEGRQQVLDRLGCGPNYVASAPTDAWGWLRGAAYQDVPPEKDWATVQAANQGPVEGFYGAGGRKKEGMGGINDKSLTEILAGVK